MRTEVRQFQPRSDRPGYVVDFVEHRDDIKNTKSLPLVRATCDNLVLAAGAFGSTFLMLKNRANFPQLSDRLGYAFNGNGDVLGLALQAVDRQTHQSRVLNPSLGTVITSALRVADQIDGDGARGRGSYIEDAGYPEFVNWLAQTTDVRGTLSRLFRFVLAWIRMHVASNPTSDLGGMLSALLGGGGFTRSSLPLLGMGREVPDGRLYLNDAGYLALDWAMDGDGGYFDQVTKVMRAIAQERGATFQEDPRLSQSGDHRAPARWMPHGRASKCGRRRQQRPGVRLPRILHRRRLGNAWYHGRQPRFHHRRLRRSLCRPVARELTHLRSPAWGSTLPPARRSAPCFEQGPISAPRAIDKRRPDGKNAGRPRFLWRLDVRSHSREAEPCQSLIVWP